jgi:hypothetical protein
MNKAQLDQIEAAERILAEEPLLNVRALRGFLAGNTWRQPGEIVAPSEKAARAAIRSGAAAGAVSSPSTLLFEGPPTEEPVPPAPERTGGIAVKVLKREFYEPTQARVFSPEDGVFFAYCDLPPELLSDPDIPLESRRGPVLELVGHSPEDHRRLIAAKKREQAGLPGSGHPCSGVVNRYGASVA